ncbi:terminase small subunit [Deinococcus gobiensis]|uniref:Terminase small subunit n=1 Tax=Deinococcus gobiensis (strain DSM 21396 / JCM 16679 / CGMCC 1.7299 / I-0) TaxID=745776 RepID=H8GX86_DEIGI|nr:terminase small subunit [Deinococcus gobiensis]AFD25815.1 hypothetical protein DGo_CA1888 [Deinococcus gobiensis I-0]
MTHDAPLPPSADELGAALPPKQRRFADYYLGSTKLNQSAAALKAGYKDHREGWNLVRLPAVKAYIAARMAEAPDVMSKDEVAARLTMEARNTVDMDDFVTVAPTPRTFWVPALEHQPVKDLAKDRGLQPEDLDVYDLDSAFGADNVSRTSDGDLLIKVATIAQDVQIDWQAAKNAGAFSGLAMFKRHPDGTIEYKVKDTTKTLQLLGQLHNMFGNRQVLENPDGSPIKFIVGVAEDDL